MRKYFLMTAMLASLMTSSLTLACGSRGTIEERTKSCSSTFQDLKLLFNNSDGQKIWYSPSKKAAYYVAAYNNYTTRQVAEEYCNNMNFDQFGSQYVWRLAYKSELYNSVLQVFPQLNASKKLTYFWLADIIERIPTFPNGLTYATSGHMDVVPFHVKANGAICTLPLTNYPY